MGVNTKYWRLSDPEALPHPVDVAQAEVHVGADALHGLDGEGPPQVVRVGPGRGQPEAEPVETSSSVRTLYFYCISSFVFHCYWAAVIKEFPPWGVCVHSLQDALALLRWSIQIQNCVSGPVTET